MEELHITETPDTLIEAIARNLVEYSVGFVRVEETPQGQDVGLLGSGTLVAIGEIRAVLTAHHVVTALPRKGRLGLILSHKLEPDTVDTQGLAYQEIARGTIDSEGPDLGAVVLASTIAGTIAAKKTFYNLAMRRDQLLQTPPDLRDGLWFVNGFVDEMTVEEPETDRYSLIKGFCNLSGAGVPEPSVSVGDHDYFAFPVSYGRRSVAPKSFEGMSGGGLWQVPIMRDAQGNLRHKTPLLSGVVFYQEPTTENRCGVKCHGRMSIYRVAYDSIRHK
jgi:hypothetical protein